MTHRVCRMGKASTQTCLLRCSSCLIRMFRRWSCHRRRTLRHRIRPSCRQRTLSPSRKFRRRPHPLLSPKSMSRRGRRSPRTHHWKSIQCNSQPSCSCKWSSQKKTGKCLPDTRSNQRRTDRSSRNRSFSNHHWRSAPRLSCTFLLGSLHGTSSLTRRTIQLGKRPGSLCRCRQMKFPPCSRSPGHKWSIRSLVSVQCRPSFQLGMGTPIGRW
jgi:hypothetical protein